MIRLERRGSITAADAGSTNRPSRPDSSCCAARICSSVTASMRPPESSLGYVRVGVIPRFSIHPETRELEGTTVMYKELT